MKKAESSARKKRAKKNAFKYFAAPISVIALGFTFLILAYAINADRPFPEKKIQAAFNPEASVTPQASPNRKPTATPPSPATPSPEPAASAKSTLPAPQPPASTPSPSPTPNTVITFAGDILLDGSVRSAIDSVGIQNIFPQESRLPFINADIAVANVEMSISRRGAPMENKEYTYRADPEHSMLLSDMGLDVVSVANNHTLDYGRDAFADTLDFLAENKIAFVGGGKNHDEAIRWETFEVNGKKIAFLAASRVIPVVEWYAGKETSGLFGTYDPTELNEQITKAKAENDYVFVYVHWGVERSQIPENWQRNMAHGYIIAGADLVVGSHPHILQGFEIFDGKLIAYSLGNFIFVDGKKDTGALQVTLSTEGDFSYKFLPYEILNRCTSVMEDDDKIENLRLHLNEISINAELDEDMNLTLSALKED